MLQTQVEVDDMLEGPVHRLLHSGRSGQAADLLEEVVVDVNEPLSHERKYIYSPSNRIYQAAACDDHSTSDIVTVAESVLSLGAVTLALGVSFVWTAKEQTIKRSSVTD